VPSDFNFKAMNSVHRALQKLSGGRVGWKAGGMPVVALTTTGRRTGQPHTVMLTSPVQTATAYVVVASRGGDDKHPAWFLNLEANPRVDVRIAGGPAQQRQARIASAEEAAEMWPQVDAMNPSYAKYRTKTTRDIPLVLLELPA